jgi:hypothetical protein
MKPYEYQILCYIPDQVSGEFLNVGILMVGPTERKLHFDFINSKQRISAVFHGIESTHIMRKLRILQQKLEELKHHDSGKLHFNEVSSVTFYSSQILTKDDSSLQFTDVKKGMDISVESAFRDLKNRLLYKWVVDNDYDYRSDEDVWRERYKQHFEQAGITKKMISRAVKTKSDTFEFEQAYKNGVWNYFQPLNLNLKKTDSIKNKVYKWKGIIAEMQTAKEEMKLIFLTEMPEKENGLSDFIKKQLNSKKEDDTFSELITPESVDELLGTFKQN